MPKLALTLAFALALAPTARAELVFFAGTVTAASGRSDIPGLPPPFVPAVGDPLVGGFSYALGPDGRSYSGTLSFRAGPPGSPVRGSPVAGLVRPQYPWVELQPTGGGVDGRIIWTPGSPGSPGGGDFDYATDFLGSGFLEIMGTVRQVDPSPVTVPEPPAWALALVGATLTVGWAGWAAHAGRRIARDRR